MADFIGQSMGIWMKKPSKLFTQTSINNQVSNTDSGEPLISIKSRSIYIGNIIYWGEG